MVKDRKEYMKIYHQQRRLNDEEYAKRCRDYSKKLYNENTEICKQKSKDYSRERLKNDPIFRNNQIKRFKKWHKENYWKNEEYRSRIKFIQCVYAQILRLSKEIK